jgi:hypothetical protein
VIGGTEFASLTTQEACEAQCISEPNCVGVDMDSNTANTFCWILYSTVDLENTRVANNVLHATLVDRCPLSKRT